LGTQEVDKVEKLSGNISGLSVYRATKLRLKPESEEPEAFLDVDGERVPYGEITVEVIPTSLQIIAGEKFYDSVEQCSKKYGIMRICIRFLNISACPYTTDTLRYARRTLKKISRKKCFYFVVLFLFVCAVKKMLKISKKV